MGIASNDMFWEIKISLWQCARFDEIDDGLCRYKQEAIERLRYTVSEEIAGMILVDKDDPNYMLLRLCFFEHIDWQKGELVIVAALSKGKVDFDCVRVPHRTFVYHRIQPEPLSVNQHITSIHKIVGGTLQEYRTKLHLWKNRLLYSLYHKTHNLHGVFKPGIAFVLFELMIVSSLLFSLMCR